MRFLVSLLLLMSSAAHADPAWFDRTQAVYTARHLSDEIQQFERDLSWNLGSQHPLTEAVRHGRFEVQDVTYKLQTNYPFDPLYQRERHFYRVTLPEIKTEWTYAHVYDPRLKNLYADVNFVSDKLHRIFNNNEARWYGTCRVILETVWGDDLQSFWGRGISDTQQRALQLAQQDGLRQCEYQRYGDNFKRCTIDYNQCWATR